MNTGNQSIRVAIGHPGQESSPRPTPGNGVEPPEAPPRVFFTPPIDIHEGPEGLVLEADLPGASEGKVTIQLEENVLCLHAQIPSPAPEGARALYEEYQLGDYFRSFILSDEVERSKISAELKNGVLRLNLPKAERTKTRRIEIKS